MFFKKHIQKGMEIRAQSTSATRARAHNPAGWFLGPGELRRGCSYGRTRGSHQAFGPSVALSRSAGSPSRRLHVGGAKLQASSRDSTWLTLGTARALQGLLGLHPARPSKSGGLSLQRKRKKLSTETHALGTGLPQEQSPIFLPELNN